MSRRFRVLVPASLVCSLVLAIPSLARQSPSGTVLQVPYAAVSFAFYRVESTTPAGEVRVIFSIPNAGGINLMEGNCLVGVRKAGDSAVRTLIPAKVVSVDSAKSATLRVAAGAIASIPTGSTLSILRPPGMTTAAFEGLPASMPIAGLPAPVPGVRSADPVEAARLAARRTLATNRLKQIGLALHNFESAYGQWPAAVLYGPDGRPRHSWRVLLLPYLEQVTLFQQYDFNEPWDSPKNRALIEKMPDVYRDPLRDDDRSGNTHVAAFVGSWKRGNQPLMTILQPSTVKRPAPDATPSIVDPRGSRIRDVIDGTSNTVVVGFLTPERKIPWTKPEDFEVDASFPGIGKPGGIDAPYPGSGANPTTKVAPLLFADGSVRTLPNTLPPASVVSLISRNGLEVVDLSSADAGGSTAGDPNMRKNLKLTLDGPRSKVSIE